VIKDAIEELKAELSRADGGSLLPASVDDLQQAKLFGFPEVLVDFYRENAPNTSDGCVELDQRIWSIRGAMTESRDYVPGAYLFPLGYVVFASNMFGDAYCVDTAHVSASGEYSVVLFPHDVIEEGASLGDVEQYRLVVASGGRSSA